MGVQTGIPYCECQGLIVKSSDIYWRKLGILTPKQLNSSVVQLSLTQISYETSSTSSHTYGWASRVKLLSEFSWLLLHPKMTRRHKPSFYSVFFVIQMCKIFQLEINQFFWLQGSTGFFFYSNWLISNSVTIPLNQQFSCSFCVMSCTCSKTVEDN